MMRKPLNLQGWLLKLAAVLTGLFMLMPLMAVIPVSFTPKRFLSLPKGDWSLRHYQALMTDEAWLASISDSVLVALASSLIATGLAVAFALGLWFRQPRYGGALVGLALLPMAVPPVVSAVIIYFLQARISLIDTYAGLILTHVIMVTPFAVIVMLTATSRLDKSLELASRNLGASRMQTTFWVVLPNLKFGLFSAWFLSLVLSWEEIAVTLFVSGIDVITLPKRIWDGLRLNVDPIIAAVSVILMVLTTIAIVAKTLYEHRKGKSGS
ncbi:ABC transporter permease [Phaeobacter inhibens]|uniref:ABC transporter permease n=1 Tax=Phaeobacter inhibens TaxID=221822 RepID=UPI0021A954C4|nr:ABC transporter permease [Phaeobacter inhibens]UWR63147.1 ABC transporter permease [Phaeobacter inhibens]